LCWSDPLPARPLKFCSTAVDALDDHFSATWLPGHRTNPRQEAFMGFSEYACASCGGPVSEGRCGTCRASREMLRNRLPLVTRQLLLQLLLALAVLLGFVAFAVEHSS
jgi:hypothetical protein